MQEIVSLKRVLSILNLSWVISTIVSLPWITHEYDDFLSIRRHRYEIRSQQVQGNEQNASTRETKPKSFNSQRIPHIPFAFNLLFATIVH